jgi:hypothetical protein
LPALQVTYGGLENHALIGASYGEFASTLPENFEAGAWWYASEDEPVEIIWCAC